MTKIDYSDSDVEVMNDFDPRKEFDPKNTPNVIADQIQETVDEIISHCPDCDWNEDLITYKIVENLRNILSHYRLPDVENNYATDKFNLEAYKLTGKAEQSHGDMAVIITRKIPYGERLISGVAFYEAKASGSSYYESDRYPSFCIQQLRRLVTHTPKLNYLIYNKNKRKINNTNWPSIEEYNKHDERNLNGEYVNALTIDANFLKQCRNIDVATNFVGQSFGRHFVDRVLSGRDLDYSRSVDETIRRWLKHTRRSAPIIVSVSVYEEPKDMFYTQLEFPEFERVRFSELDDKLKYT